MLDDINLDLLSEDEQTKAVEMSLLQRALSGDVRACSYWLKNRRPEKWQDRPHGLETSDLSDLQGLAELIANASETRVL